MEKTEFLSVSREDIERVQKRAYACKDEWEATDDGVDEDAEALASMEILIDFCEVLLGRETVDGFLRSQDMEG